MKKLISLIVLCLVAANIYTFVQLQQSYLDKRVLKGIVQSDLADIEVLNQIVKDAMANATCAEHLEQFEYVVQEYKGQ